MSYPPLSQVTVLDLVPFGNTGSHTSFYALRLTPPAWESWMPGQFVMLRPSGGWHDKMWARPFSLCRVTSRDLVIFFQVVGGATEQLATLVPGDTLDVWGPLGNGLCVEKDTETLLLAGGIGIVPFVGYVHAHPAPWNVTMEFGLRTAIDYYPFDSINEKILVDVHLERNEEDRARFVALMEERISAHAEKGLVLACGPTPFLKTVQALALKHKARTQLCLETVMACGVGACLGCVVKAVLPEDQKEGSAPVAHYVQTCTCGPNFWADAVTL